MLVLLNVQGCKLSLSSLVRHVFCNYPQELFFLGELEVVLLLREVAVYKVGDVRK